MGRRVIAPETWDDEWFGTLDDRSALVWFGVVTRLADDQGRLPDNAVVARARLFPYREDVTAADVRAALDAFAEAERVIRYEVDGRGLLQIRNWWRHQKPRWAARSKYPAPEGWHDRVRTREDGQYTTENWEGEGGDAPTLADSTNVHTVSQSPNPSPSPSPNPSPHDDSGQDHWLTLERQPASADPTGIERSCPDTTCELRKVIREALADIGDVDAKSVRSYIQALCIEAETITGELTRGEREEVCKALIGHILQRRFLDYHSGPKGPIKNLPSFVCALSKEAVISESMRERTRSLVAHVLSKRQALTPTPHLQGDETP